MAEQSYTESEMLDEHRQTFHGFMTLAKYSAIGVAVLLLLMAFFLL
jgi:hypothetical protein